jgi:hypothetical protein
MASPAYASQGGVGYPLEVPGIPVTRTRTDPISPLAMMASGSIMADAAASVMGKNLNRRQRKGVHRQVYRFAGANALVYSPVAGRWMS